jgi:chromosome segregation ATPase
LHELSCWWWLYLLAESREESLALAKQLAAAKSDVHKLRASAARLNSRVEAAELMRADAEVAAEQLRQRLERLVGSSHEVTKQRSDMAQVGSS